MKITDIKISLLGSCAASEWRGCEGLTHIKTLPYLSVVQSLSGSYSIAVNDGERYETGPGGIFIAASGAKQTIVHHEDPVSGKMRARWVFFCVGLNDMGNMDIFYDYPVLAEGPLHDALHAALDDYFLAESAGDDAGKIAACLTMARGLMAHARPRSAPLDKRLSDVLDFIKAHYAEKIGVRDFAGIAGVSPPRFYSLFKSNFGMGALAYLNDYRLSVASDLLIRSDLRVGEIADRVGFDDRLYFSRLFRRKFKLPPSQYRKTVAVPGV